MWSYRGRMYHLHDNQIQLDLQTVNATFTLNRAPLVNLWKGLAVLFMHSKVKESYLQAYSYLSFFIQVWDINFLSIHIFCYALLNSFFCIEFMMNAFEIYVWWSF